MSPFFTKSETYIEPLFEPEIVGRPEVRGSLPGMTGFVEIYDGTNWYKLATQQHVVDTNAIKMPCLCATTVDLGATYARGSANNGVGDTLSIATLVIDGITPTVGSRILVKNQTAPLQNGIYVVTTASPFVLTRADDFDFVLRIKKGMIVPVVSGTANASAVFMEKDDIVTVGVSPITFTSLIGGYITQVTGVVHEISVANIGSVAEVGIADNPLIPGTGAIGIPVGTTAQRPGVDVSVTTPLTIGMIRFNTGV